MSRVDAHKVGFIALDQWGQKSHQICEAPRHAGFNLPAVAVIALARLLPNGDLDPDNYAVWGACKECFGMMDRDMEGPWHLPGPYGSIWGLSDGD